MRFRNRLCSLKLWASASSLDVWLCVFVCVCLPAPTCDMLGVQVSLLRRRLHRANISLSLDSNLMAALHGMGCGWSHMQKSRHMPSSERHSGHSRRPQPRWHSTSNPAKFRQAPHSSGSAKYERSCSSPPGCSNNAVRASFSMASILAPATLAMPRNCCCCCSDARWP